MAKKAKVWDGSAWQDLASATTDLTPYSTTAQMNTAIDDAVAGLGLGLKPLSSGSFSASSALNLSNVFSDTYKTYLLQINYAASVSVTDNNIRFRENTTDKATGYNYAGMSAGQSSSLGSTYASSDTQIFLNQSGTTGTFAELKINRYSATTGQVIANVWNAYNSKAEYRIGGNTGMSNFTGISFYNTTGTITGSYKLYGYE